MWSIDNRLDELQEKYNQEVEGRKRLETELKVLQVKVRTLFYYVGLFILLIVIVDLNINLLFLSC